MEDFKTRVKQVSGIIPIPSLLPVSLEAKTGLTFSSFNYVHFHFLAVHKEAISLEHMLGPWKINPSRVQAPADGCCSAQADAFDTDIPSWSRGQQAESWICPGDQSVLPSSGFIFLGLAEMDLRGEIRRSIMPLICKYHSVFCIMRQESDHSIAFSPKAPS